MTSLFLKYYIKINYIDVMENSMSQVKYAYEKQAAAKGADRPVSFQLVIVIIIIRLYYY